jgi:hypothetical protein
MGTKWLTRVLSGVADHYGLTLQWINNDIDSLDTTSDLVVFNHSDLCAQELEPCVGSHMLRDLRDVVVSGYFYHLWTKERWATVPQAKYQKRSYQQYLNTLSQNEGIHAEIDRLAEYVSDRRMREWNYGDARFLELKYEDVFGNEERGFRRLFEHYGFTPQAVNASVKIATSFSFDKLVASKTTHERKKSHLRSGQPGEWRTTFDEDHKRHFKEVMGDVLVLTGYEDDMNW